MQKKTTRHDQKISSLKYKKNKRPDLSERSKRRKPGTIERHKIYKVKRLQHNKKDEMVRWPRLEYQMTMKSADQKLRNPEEKNR